MLIEWMQKYCPAGYRANGTQPKFNSNNFLGLFFIVVTL